MPNSLKCEIKKLRFKGKITAEECEKILKKLDGHDREILLRIRNEIDDEMNKHGDESPLSLFAYSDCRLIVDAHLANIENRG